MIESGQHDILISFDLAPVTVGRGHLHLLQQSCQLIASHNYVCILPFLFQRKLVDYIFGWVRDVMDIESRIWIRLLKYFIKVTVTGVKQFWIIG